MFLILFPFVLFMSCHTYLTFLTVLWIFCVIFCFVYMTVLLISSFVCFASLFSFSIMSRGFFIIQTILWISSFPPVLFTHISDFFSRFFRSYVTLLKQYHAFFVSFSVLSISLCYGFLLLFVYFISLCYVPLCKEFIYLFFFFIQTISRISSPVFSDLPMLLHYTFPLSLVRFCLFRAFQLL